MSQNVTLDDVQFASGNMGSFLNGLRIFRAQSSPRNERGQLGQRKKPGPLRGGRAQPGRTTLARDCVAEREFCLGYSSRSIPQVFASTLGSMSSEVAQTVPTLLGFDRISVLIHKANSN